MLLENKRKLEQKMRGKAKQSHRPIDGRTAIGTKIDRK